MVVPLLEELLRVDIHLAATCRVPMKLAAALDAIVLTHLADSPRAPGSQGTLDQITDFLVAALFEDDYSRRLYFRFYNLDIAQSPLQIPGVPGELDRVEDWDIPDITGETTPTSTLHFVDTGNVFLVVTDTGPEEDNDWWLQKWNEASALAAVLKYLKYAVIEVDYSAIHFSPEWLNEVRRYGVSLWGRPRTDVQPRRYTLDSGEEQSLIRSVAAAAHFKPLLEDLGPPLRRALATAGDYYEGHHKRTTPEDKLIDLAIALEALFSPSGASELRFRIAHRAALLLGRDPDDRRSLFSFLRKTYDARSGLVHEGKSPFPETAGIRMTLADLERLADLVRQAILRLSVLYARERPSRDDALRIIEECAYDPATLTALRERTDLDTFLREQDF